MSVAAPEAPADEARPTSTPLRSEAAIEARGLTKTYRVYRKREGLLAGVGGLFRREYNEVHAVRDVSFRVEPGEMLAFLGPNGAGKTTTLKLLAGLIHPSAGEASVLGYTPWERANAYRRRFSLVMGQKNQLWWDLPAQESFNLHREIYNVPAAEFSKRLDELVDLLKVRKLIGQPVRELSLGERMRMELIAALLHAPEVLFLDEPTIGLDVVSQRTVQTFLKTYQAERGTTVVLTSHYMKDVEALCERAVIIDDGKLRHDGPLSEIVERFSTHKIIELSFAGEVPNDLERYGTPLKAVAPRARIEVARAEIPRVLADLLDRHRIEDVSVNDRPLEEVIADLFGEHDAEDEAAERALADRELSA
ncbi:ABC transporter ATP-binding protein [Alienimonas chondri]|uniref:Vitamin B12 import ATP-binding protein BtuD n=1 Tax=Alienimonas chondri TaxID=2681879 RepID=A0ABX1VKV4_9PLAN|nr:ABC transporter ATP-binding protein [Alienimonas chondri]NNJ27966.1 Vitamin B12 import ATP-binding protein BtuD [Alienimonas chondri]